MTICIKCKKEKMLHAKKMCKRCYNEHNYFNGFKTKKDYVNYMVDYHRKNRAKYNLRQYANLHFRDQLIKSDGKCANCGTSERIELHHKKYTKNIEDIQLLCNSCHKKEHVRLKNAL